VGNHDRNVERRAYDYTTRAEPFLAKNTNRDEATGGAGIMPTYEYRCDGPEAHTFEIEQAINDPAFTICQKCGGGTKRLLFASNIVFKGEGWTPRDLSTTAKWKEVFKQEKKFPNPKAKLDIW
jgi:putative FmdB family regulatory protein